MFTPVDIPPDPLGWRWYIPLMIMVAVGSIVPLLTKSEAPWQQKALANIWLVTWLIIAVSYRFFLGWVYGE